MSSEVYTLFPIVNQSIYEKYKKATACFWFVEDIDITEDKKDWNTKLTQREKDFIKYILAFFAASDGIVMENLVCQFYTNTENAEGRNFYAFQMAMEAIHNEMYSLLIDTYIQNETEKKKLFAAIETIPVVKNKAEWAMKWINPELPWEQRLIAFAMVEGIFFSGAFCSIYWLKSRGLMPGLALSNDLISRDEGLHMEHACEQYKLIEPENRIPVEIVYKMIEEAVAVEDGFVEEALTFNLRGMNAKLMKQYIRYVADRLLTMLEYDKLYNAEMPFDFMEMIGMGLKMNFFEGRNGEYQRSNILEVYNQRKNEEVKEDVDVLKVLQKFANEHGLDTVDINQWYNNTDRIEETECLELSDDF
jgi:ribonucleoside-diphosphate reductase beta chain